MELVAGSLALSDRARDCARKRVLDPFRCYLRVMMLRGDKDKQLQMSDLILTRVGWMDFDAFR